MGHVVDLKQLLEDLAIIPAGPVVAKEKYPEPQWIGTKIEEIYSKKIPNYKVDTTLVQTDKVAGGDIALLRNVDQDLAAIGRGQKNNSGNYGVSINRLKRDGTAVCLEIYGKRIPKNSEFINIIQINSFPGSDDKYKKLSGEDRDAECKKHKDDPLSTIVYPKQ